MFASQAWVAVGRVYWMEFDKGGNWKQTGTRAHDATGSSSSSFASLSPILRVVTHSFRTTPMYERCTYTGIISLINGSHRRRRPRTSTHAHTDARDRPTDRHAQGTSAHRRSSNRIALSLSRSTSLYPSLSIANSHDHSLSLSFSLSWLFRILATHLPIISQSS